MAPKIIYKLDPTSDRYRVCPECKKAFMANHRSRDFHTKKCANEYNNRIKKLQKHAVDVINNSDYAEEAIDKGLIKDELVPKLTQNIEDKKSTKISNQIIDVSIQQEIEELLSSILGDKEELETSWLDVSSLGLDFNSYDSIEQLPNCDLNKVNYGSYSIVWSQPDKILLTYQKHLLWTLTL